MKRNGTMKNASLSVAIMACAMLTACAAGVGGPRADPPDHLQATPADRRPNTNIDAAGLDKLLRGHVKVHYSPWWGGNLGKGGLCHLV